MSPLAMFIIADVLGLFILVGIVIYWLQVLKDE